MEKKFSILEHSVVSFPAYLIRLLEGTQQIEAN